jgi:hypothetical protein
MISEVDVPAVASSISSFTKSGDIAKHFTTTKLDATGHRWLADLATYDFNIKYRPGKNNADADGLSRTYK